MNFKFPLLATFACFLALFHPPAAPCASQETVKIPDTRLMFDSPMRDPSVCRGGDGYYYLTGTSTGNMWTWNEGIELWRSKDLVHWEPLGLIWSIERDGTWHKEWTQKVVAGKKPTWRRVVWAPEIHYIKGTYYICYCMPGLGIGVLRSTTGKANGPYTSTITPDQPLLHGFIDATLFEDDDRKVYLAYGPSMVVRLKDDLSGLAEEPHRVHTVPADLEPLHHSPGHCKKTEYDHIGFEGPFIFKNKGRYYFACADSCEGRYSCMIASSDNIYGPYGPRKEAIPKGGHSTFFLDDNGKWWAACFHTQLNERPALVPIEVGTDGAIKTLPLPN